MSILATDQLVRIADAAERIASALEKSSDESLKTIEDGATFRARVSCQDTIREAMNTMNQLGHSQAAGTLLKALKLIGGAP